MRRTLILLTLLPLAACGQGGDAADPPVSDNEFTARAEQVAHTWSAVDPSKEWSRGMLLDEVTKSPGEDKFDEGQATAFARGWYELDTTLPREAPDDKVVFADGEEQFDPVSAEEAFAALDVGGAPPPDCPTEPVPDETSGDDSDGTASHTLVCGTLTVTGVEATTTPRWTSRGMAEFPAWEFTVDGVDEPITTLATVMDDKVELPPMAPPEFDKPQGMRSAHDLVSITDSKLGFRVTGGACDVDFQPLIHHTDDVIVVAGTAASNGEDVCTDQAVLTPVSAALSEPVGDRMILDAVSGQVLRFGGGEPIPS
jgi:hypothetical protein